MALSVAPASFLTRIDSVLFRVRLPLSFSFPLVQMWLSFGFLWTPSCSVFESRCVGTARSAVKSAAARVCLEAGGRVTLNMMVKDMDLPVPQAHNTRRLELVTDGLPLFGVTQLASDTTLVCTCDSSARRGAAHRDGVALVAARRTQERTYPELIGPRARWSELASAKARSDRASLDVEVGFNLGVQRCSGFRCFSAELASRRRCGWECAQDSRSGESSM